MRHIYHWHLLEYLIIGSKCWDCLAGSVAWSLPQGDWQLYILVSFWSFFCLCVCVWANSKKDRMLRLLCRLSCLVTPMGNLGTSYFGLLVKLPSVHDWLVEKDQLRVLQDWTVWNMSRLKENMLWKACFCWVYITSFLSCFPFSSNIIANGVREISSRLRCYSNCRLAKR